MGKAQRDKGARLEREVAERLRPLDPSAKRNITECQESSWDVTTKLPLIIQCKNLAKWSTSPHECYKEANRHRHGGKIPLVWARITNKSPDLVLISADDFMELLECYMRLKKPESHLAFSFQEQPS